jgi:hypothetical protein
MTMHPRRGDKKRTLCKKELDALREGLQREIERGGASQYHLDLLTDLANAKRVVIVTTKR